MGFYHCILFLCLEPIDSALMCSSYKVVWIQDRIERLHLKEMLSSNILQHPCHWVHKNYPGESSMESWPASHTPILDEYVWLTYLWHRSLDRSSEQRRMLGLQLADPKGRQREVPMPCNSFELRLCQWLQVVNTNKLIQVSGVLELVEQVLTWCLWSVSKIAQGWQG